MWSRKRIDIGWSDLLFGYRQAMGAGDRASAARDAESSFTNPDRTLACLSVRSGFDLLWTELRLPPGSEVLMSAVTILDMARIVEEHGLIPVPIDVDPDTMKPNLDAFRSAITPNTRAIVVAHLFGAILDLDDIAGIAAEYNLLFIEDCAQAFDGRRYIGHCAADVVMFSFGPIKTATALAGGLMIVRNAELLQRMRRTHAAWPEQSPAEFRRRIRAYSILKLVSGKFAFTLLVKILRVLGKDLDRTLNGAVRNFPAESFFKSLRRQPCPALLRLLSRRIATFDTVRQDRRSSLGRMLADALLNQPSGTETRLERVGLTIPGAQAARHTWWVFPVCCESPPRLIARLREAGFDATCGSQMQPISAPLAHPATSPMQAASTVSTMFFLPFYPEMPDHAVLRMANIVKNGGAGCASHVEGEPAIPHSNGIQTDETHAHI